MACAPSAGRTCRARGRDASGLELAGRGVAEALFVTPAAVEKHVTSIFHKLQLGASPNGHKRVLAAITYLRNAGR